MDFRVLGPVQVAAVELASGRQVALLACLLIAGDEVSSRDRLIDALWGESPPASATNALQVQVHALRRRLGSDRIVTEGPATACGWSPASWTSSGSRSSWRAGARSPHLGRTYAKLDINRREVFVEAARGSSTASTASIAAMATASCSWSGSRVVSSRSIMKLVPQDGSRRDLAR